MKRETKKIVEIQGRKFEIRSFDAFTGSYIAFTLMEKMLPMGMEAKVMNAVKADGGDASVSLPSRALMSKGEFIAFQRDVLSVVGEVLPARTAPLFNENGSWGVADIEDNAMLVIMLTIHALVFNIAGFFTGDGLKELKAGLQSLSFASTAT
nr:MAG TPA: tail assembly chaperone protein [Caudoviricetes sp.]